MGDVEPNVAVPAPTGKRAFLGVVLGVGLGRLVYDGLRAMIVVCMDSFSMSASVDLNFRTAASGIPLNCLVRRIGLLLEALRRLNHEVDIVLII